jgi:hypothetical protein
LLSLVCYLGGMRGSHPAVRTWDHLSKVIGRRAKGGRQPHSDSRACGSNHGW